MNSSTLKEKGFADLVSLKGLSFANLPSDKSCVLVLVDSSLSGKPISDILYIGKSKKIAKRVFGGYIAGYGGKASRKIHSALFSDDFFEKVTISWLENDNPKIAQQELLESFKKEHGEYPVWNAAKKDSPKPKPQPVHKSVKKPRVRKSTKP